MRRALASFLLLVGVTLGWASAAHAARVVEVGWWDRNADALLPALDPPPEGALRVANDPTGASAVAAVRFVLEEDEQDPTLVLRTADEPVPDGAGFVACPASSDWEPADGGPIDDAPTADCEISAALGAVAADGASVSFDLSTFPDAPAFDVVVSPAPSGTNPVADTYAVDFEAPADTDVVAAAPVATPAGAPAAPTGGPSAAPTIGGGSPGITPGPSPSSGGSFRAPSGTPSVTVPAAPAPASGREAGTNGGSTPSAPVAQVASPPLDVADADAPRWVGLVIALAAVLLGVHLWRTDRERAAMTAGPVLGGLGRFARERTAPAPDVS